jgi:hypothetical protein
LGPGGIIVVDLDSGAAWGRLSGHIFVDPASGTPESFIRAQELR